ncbi:RING finger domain and kelch repeat-containing protein DDB_G0271372-like [Ruditapes philippinarum]|uniref:RING finger domain and kelch repeat-containing protein DDB_G0271372-like n=1 Tax=Ruditapes philippinarum TaxID=129788 RepID=UPI00295B2A31|nr:RING finger domain and kelch repeat-containing protein DDB_G0271372-like [Ruditapes philippinarum]
MELETIVLNANCSVHSEGQLKYYCEDHDTVICDACCHTEHNKCLKIVDLNNASQGVKNHQQHKIKQASLNNLKDDLEKLKVTRNDDNRRIEEEKRQIRTKMQNAASKLKNKLDNLLKTRTATIMA